MLSAEATNTNFMVFGLIYKQKKMGIYNQLFRWQKLLKLWILWTLN